LPHNRQEGIIGRVRFEKFSSLNIKNKKAGSGPPFYTWKIVSLESSLSTQYSHPAILFPALPLHHECCALVPFITTLNILYYVAA
jgi:hypothetical protein